VVHDLQQDVEHVRVRLLDLVEQDDAVRMLVDLVGQEAALVVADVAWRRADQPADRVPLHVLRHVEAQQLDAQRGGQLLGDLGLADAGGPAEQVAADRLLRVAEAGAGHLHGRGQLLDRLVLAVDRAVQVGLQVAQRLGVDLLTDFGGMRAILATMASTSSWPMIFFRSASGTSIWLAPASSITSIALSGSLRSLMYLAASSTDDLMAPSV
jgi:hypothetical protein